MKSIDKINDDLKKAMKDRDEIRLTTLRSVKTAVKNKSVELRRDIDEPEFLQIVNTLAKQRRESIEQFESGGRNDLAELEKKELCILESYLPPALSEEELVTIIDQTMNELGAESSQDMGKLMKAVMSKVTGRADGKIVNTLVRKKLQA